MESLGKRCVDWCLQYEGVKEEPPRSNDGPFIREWLKGCYRGYGQTRKLLGVSKTNWCSAFQGASMEACLIEGEVKPHDYRAGVVEMVKDTLPLRNGNYRFSGRYKPVQLTRKNIFIPSIGDLVIWDRSIKGRPETSWWRHVNRLIEFEETSFKTIGGNEKGGLVRIGEHTINKSNLLGWIHYPQIEQETTDEIIFTEEEKREVRANVAMCLQGLIDDIQK